MTITQVHSIARVPAARRRAQCSTSRAGVWSALHHAAPPLHVLPMCCRAAPVIYCVVVWRHDCVNWNRCFGIHASVVGVWAGVEGGAWLDKSTMLTFVFAVWSAARALGWACEVVSSPEAEEAPVLPRLRSARASSDLSTLSTTTTSSSQTSSGEHPKRSTALLNKLT